MEPVSDEDRRMRKGYRVVLILAAMAALAVTAWMLIPPKPLDLRFLAELHPRLRKEDYGIYLDFKMKPAELEKVLDAKLTSSEGWKKDKVAGGGYSHYVNRSRSMPSLMLSPNYTPLSGPVAIPGAAPSAPVANGTTLEVQDPRGTAVLP